MKSTHPRRRWPAVVLAAGIGGAAATMSYAALADLAAGHGVPDRLAWLWPISVDGLIIAATLLVVAAPAERYGRWLLSGAVAVSVAANMVHALDFGALGVLVAAVPPVGLVAAVHVVVVLGRTPVNTGHQAVTVATTESGNNGSVNTAPAPAAVNTEPATGCAERTPSSVNTPAPAELPAATVKRPTRAEYTSRARRALSAAHRRGEHPAVTVSWVQSASGCSRGTAQKIAAELRRPALAEAVDQ